jgi:hypothetical protein
VLLAINTVVIGLLTASFVQGPYSSDEQELWYRYGSLAFFLAGSVMPAITMFAARRSRAVIAASTAWMLIMLLAFVWFAMISSGGVSRA